ncbi:unnamed protein product [Leptidea sinapis]|uniref:BTB domain-containing protein n=1 Tax=Leptidea sinapis TaxID=189913 RepID=A0A5E4QJI8_9NEOP|nr:unnamed protein product [Leptidea sinapis]
MAPIRYSLHYEDYSEHMMSRFGKLLQMQSLVDMTLMCSSHTLRVHKAVLAACSAYFQEVLQKRTGEPLIILNMRFGVMKCLVEFMYCGKTQCPEEYLDELVSAAQFLKIKGLSKQNGSWDGSGTLGRAAERALMRREQDSRKAIHHLKNLQSRQMQDYMDRTLSQAVSTICEPESNSNYMNMDSDLIYMDRTVSPNVLDTPMPFSKERSVGNETVTSSFATASDMNKSCNNGISDAMSQYVNVLKNAGLPTDLPILFESGDGSYINVNEQVLLDMVQSNEIQYEVIEQPNIIEKVADPSEIKSIDDLSKSIKRGEMLIGSNNNFMSNNSNFEKTIGHEDAINSLNSLLPDGLDTYNESQNYGVIGDGLQNNSSSIDSDNTNDFSCIDNDMQFFTKSMSEDVKKYYEDQPLGESRSIDHLCPASTSLDTSFSMSLLDTKNSNDNMSNQFNPLNPVRSDCYDFSLQLSQTPQFKEDDIDCLISSTKQSDVERSYDSDRNETRVQDQDEIMKDLIDLENKIRADNSDSNLNLRETCKESDIENLNSIFQNDNESAAAIDAIDSNKNFSPAAATDLQWDRENTFSENIRDENTLNTKPDQVDSAIDLTEKMTNTQDDNCVTSKNSGISDETDNLNAMPKEDIPFAVGLLPLKQFHSVEESIDNICKRKLNDDDLRNVDAKCLKRKVKHKIVDN